MTPYLVLAAGASSRLGRPKQLLLLEGEPLVRHAARMALEAGGGPVFVLLGHAEDECRAALAGLDVTPLPAPEWHQGMGETIRVGVEHVQEHLPDADGVVILPCDQLRLTAGHLATLRDSGRSSAANRAASLYGDGLHTPAYYGKGYFRELARLTGDVGGKHLLDEEGTASVPFAGGGDDVDTEEDWKRLTH